MADAVRRAARETDPTLPVLSLKTFSAAPRLEHANLHHPRWRDPFLSSSVRSPLALAIVGVYGVKAYSVATPHA
jgi:hypothetical protein